MRSIPSALVAAVYFTNTISASLVPRQFNGFGGGSGGFTAPGGFSAPAGMPTSLPSGIPGFPNGGSGNGNGGGSTFGGGSFPGGGSSTGGGTGTGGTNNGGDTGGTNNGGGTGGTNDGGGTGTGGGTSTSTGGGSSPGGTGTGGDVSTGGTTGTGGDATVGGNTPAVGPGVGVIGGDPGMGGTNGGGLTLGGAPAEGGNGIGGIAQAGAIYAGIDGSGSVNCSPDEVAENAARGNNNCCFFTNLHGQARGGSSFLGPGGETIYGSGEDGFWGPCENYDPRQWFDGAIGRAGNQNVFVPPDLTFGMTGINFHYARVLRVAHGAIAAVAIVFFFPIGAILLRLLPGRLSVILHALCQLLALTAFTAAIGIGIFLGVYVRSGDYNLIRSYHAVIGLIVFVFLLLQPLSGILHHLGFRRHGNRTFISHTHIWFGRIFITLGMINGGFGLWRTNNASRSSLIGYGTVAAFMWIFWMIAACVGEARRGGRRRKERKSKKSTKGAAAMTRAATPPPRKGEERYAKTLDDDDD